MRRLTRDVPWISTLMALGVVTTTAGAQTVLPMTPQTQSLERCHKLVIVRPSDAASAAREVLAASGTTADQRLAATVCLAVAQILSEQREAGAASADEALALLDAPGVSPAGKLDGQLRLPAALVRLGRVGEALALQEEVLVAARERGIVPMQIEALRFMATIRATEFDDPEGALAHFRQAYDLHRAMVGTSGNVNPPLSYDLGYTLMLLGKHDEADVLFAEAATAAAAIPELAGMVDRIDSHRAEIVRSRGDAADAERRLTAVLSRQRAGEDTLGEVATLHRLARARLDLGRAQEALAPAREALELAERGHHREEMRDALDVLVDVHVELGEHAVAVEYAKRAGEVTRSLDRDAAARGLASMQARAADTAFAPAAVMDRQARERNVLLLSLALITLGTLALVALLLLARARYRQRQLEMISVTDSLTRLPNRLGATRRLAALDGDMSTRAALLLVDIDRFKAINDRLGHAVGDLALEAVAHCLRESCDAGDMVARWGGEEFLVLRENTSQEAAFALAAHLRAQVERLRADDGSGAPLQLSVSIGAASLPLFPRGNGDWRVAMRAADRALYRAKRSGRNAWIGLWGLEAGVDADTALDDVPAALDKGWFAVGANRPTDWSEERVTAGAE